MSEAHDRRSFFKQLLRGAAQTAAEVGDAFRDAQEPLLEAAREDPFNMTWSASTDDRPVPAPPAARAATEDELRALAEEAGLGARVEDVVAHASTSLRLSPGEHLAKSRLGGLPDVPPWFEWPLSRTGAQLSFVAQLRLEEVAAADPSLPLPKTGSLLVFYDLDRRPNGLQPDDRDSWRVLHVDADAADLVPMGGGTTTLVEMPLSFSREVTLPSESAGLPRALELEVDELDAWQRLRERLAEAQGVEVEDRSIEWHALHRLLGHPDSTDDSMAVDAQLAFNGIDLNAGERYFDERVPDLEHGADAWRLLLQVSSDDALALQLGYPLGRIYVWIRDGDLAQGRFEDAWAFIR